MTMVDHEAAPVSRVRHPAIAIRRPLDGEPLPLIALRWSRVLSLDRRAPAVRLRATQGQRLAMGAMDNPAVVAITSPMSYLHGRSGPGDARRAAARLF